MNPQSSQSHWGNAFSSDIFRVMRLKAARRNHPVFRSLEGALFCLQDIILSELFWITQEWLSCLSSLCSAYCQSCKEYRGEKRVSSFSDSLRRQQGIRNPQSMIKTVKKGCLSIYSRQYIVSQTRHEFVCWQRLLFPFARRGRSTGPRDSITTVYILISQ